MDTTYRLTQTGAEVQQILNNVPEISEELLKKYTKPVDGIPDSDLAAAIQQALEKAVTAYQEPQGGIPESDLAVAVQNLLAAAGTAYQKPQSGIPGADLATAVQELLTAAGTAYQKPPTGVPLTDLSASVQAAINAAAQASADIAAERAAREAAINSEASARIEGDAVLRQLITQVTNSLVNYYLKSETYSKTEVNAIVDQIRQFQYKVVAALPTASAETEGFIYLVPSNNPKTQNVKEEYVTIAETDGSTTTYKWEHIGDTNIDLSGYYTSVQVDSILNNYSTTSQMNAAITAAINTALASYYTKTEIDNLVGTINQTIAAKASQTDFDALAARVLFQERSFGKYDTQRQITLSQAKAGKYVSVAGAEVSASGYGISNSIELLMGDILLIPSAQAVPADVSPVARVVTRTYQKVINYAYTYQQENPELYDTATADYDQTLVYTAVYDTSGETPVLTGWTRGGQTYQTLPATHEVTESYYEPLIKQSVAAMPSTGYYVYLCPQAMTVVISGLTATVDGGVCLAVGWGIFKNIVSNFLSMPGQNVVAQAIAVLTAAVAGHTAQLQDLGECKAKSIDFEDWPKICGYPLVIEGSGAPAIVPRFAGQRYHDTTNRKCYEAFTVTNNVSDWVLLN